ncbi:MAG: hypothetical protein QOH58_2336 [Thermoleophilaceae bacterium]|jgi:hypothetical protein|nr:hypothetical protein [Thermoleophilaceae bacterium]
MKRFLRTPSPAMVVACVALFVSLGGVSYAVATIGSDDIINGSIRNRDFKDGTLRGQEAKPDGFGGGAIKEQSLDATKIKQVPSAVIADGVTRHAVVSNVGATVRSRGTTSSAQTGPGQYEVIFDRDVRQCIYVATLGDESASGPGTGQIAVTSVGANVNGVRVVTRDSDGVLANRSFHVVVSC